MPRFFCEALEAHPCYLGRLASATNNPFTEHERARTQLEGTSTTIDIEAIKRAINTAWETPNGQGEYPQFADGKSALLGAARLASTLMTSQYADQSRSLHLVEQSIAYKPTGGQHIGFLMAERRIKANNQDDGFLIARVYSKDAHIIFIFIVRPRDPGT